MNRHDSSHEPLPDRPDAPDVPDDVLQRDAAVVEEAEPPGGPFRSWGFLYLLLIVYAVLTIIALWIVTLTMNAA